jgi:hypothetical protein
VASFGKIVHLQQSPTNKVEDARKAIGRVPNDESGMENPCAALQFCMKNLRTRFKTFVIVVTDERGDDTMNDQMLENTVEMLKRMQVRVFVFGREANFSTPVIKEPYRDPKSGQTVQVETDVGPETAESEFFTPDELFFRSDVMPAGFGMWGLARICSESKGRYYFLNPGPQVYDSVRLEACAPDLISRKQYEERRERVVPRRKILAVVQEWDKVRPESRVQSQNVMTMVPFYMNKIDKANAFCTEGITALKGLQFTGLDPKYMPTRWTAHRDLAVAELYKFKYLLEEYKEGFKGLRGAPLSRNGGPLQGFFATLVPRQGGGTTPVSKKLYESATAQFSMVMEKYAKTPWGAIAANELKTMGIITVQPQYAAPAEERREERERQPPRKPPEPPKV